MRWLVADDSDLSMGMAVDILESFGEKAHGVTSGEEAIEYLGARPSDQADLVLIDYRMPGMNGAETAVKIREVETAAAKDDPGYRKVVLIAMSGDRDEETLGILRAAGVDRILSKPIEPEKLMELAGKGQEILIKPEADQPRETSLYDRKTGIRYSGSEQLWLQYLGNFLKSYPGTREKITGYFEENDLRNFTIEVHALKSTARMLGNLSLSDAALELEKLGDREDATEIDRKLPAFLNLFEESRQEAEDLLKDREEKSQDRDKKPEDPKLVREILEAMAEAVESFDIDSLDRCNEDLKNMDLPKERKEQFKVLDEKIAEVDLEAVSKGIKKLLDEY